MESLISKLSTNSVSDIPNNPHAPFPHADLYKLPNTTDGQENRRKEILLKQKKNRAEICDTARHLSNDNSRQTKHRGQYKNALYADQLMLAEWMVDIPEDFPDMWIAVPCPVGRRRLLVTSGNYTSIYTKNGVKQEDFSSLLPNAQKNRITMLDCVQSDKKIFVLDVIYWNGQTLANCETEFRFQWLKSKFDEMPELSVPSSRNKYSILLAPNFNCIFPTLRSLMSSKNIFESESMELETAANNVTTELDGLLFYHKECSYEPGHMPLVNWLKPYMLPDVLSVPVYEEFLQQRPSDYTTLQAHIDASKLLKRNWWTQNN